MTLLEKAIRELGFHSDRKLLLLIAERLLIMGEQEARLAADIRTLTDVVNQEVSTLASVQAQLAAAATGDADTDLGALADSVEASIANIKTSLASVTVPAQNDGSTPVPGSGSTTDGLGNTSGAGADTGSATGSDAGSGSTGSDTSGAGLATEGDGIADGTASSGAVKSDEPDPAA